VTDAFLEIPTSFDAPIEDVFDAWTKADLLKQWFVCVDAVASKVEIDFRVGGRYRIQWDDLPDGSKAVIGSYLQIEKPSLVSFTWQWEGSESPATLITIEFAPSGSGTRIRLRHTRFQSNEDRDEHLYGWGRCMEGLGGFLKGRPG